MGHRGHEGGIHKARIQEMFVPGKPLGQNVRRIFTYNCSLFFHFPIHNNIIILIMVLPELGLTNGLGF